MSAIKNRLYGLDTLRAAAILLVFMFHYSVFVSHQSTFSFFSEIGWAGVDLFFILSGYIIANQIFSSLASKRKFSLKTFFYRRLMRTLPNYFFILALYFLLPSFRETSSISPLWKFLTFTQNLGLHTGVAFSHAWSLCVEEQFYLTLPLLALLIAFKGSKRTGWRVICFVLVGGVILRGFLWIHCYMHSTENNFKTYYYSYIYYPTFCRLDELVLGVAIAMMKNFHREVWDKLITNGNLFLVLGTIGTTIIFYLFLNYHFIFFMTVFGFPMLALSFAGLMLAALSPNSLLYKTYIPGAATIAAWSYAIYLTHKAFIVKTSLLLTKLGISSTSFITVIASVFVSLIAGWLLYKYIEMPFLKLRDRMYKRRETAPALTQPSR